MNIPGNSFCPCQSGLRYKKCCMIHPERSEAAASLNAQYIAPSYVLSNLKQRSHEMVHFLDTVPAEILLSLWVFIKPDLNANMRSMAGYDHYAIIIKKMPLPEADFFDFAHEIGHIILAQQKYPSVVVSSDSIGMMSLGTILTNTIMDPLVNRLVANSGFDLAEYMKKAIRIQSPGIKNMPHDTVRNRHYLRCLCIEKILEWRILDIPFENAFLPIFQKYHPNEYAFANAFVDSLDISRLDDPEYVRDELSRLIKENQVQGILYLM